MAEKKITLDDYVFWQGKVRFNAGQHSHDVNCRIFLDATPDKDLRIEVANELGFAALGLINEETYRSKIPGVINPIGLLMSNAPWRDPSSWLDNHHGEPIVELFEPFCEKLADPGWRDTFSHVVYWFQRAKTDSAGPDGACILLQASLERFGWHLLVRERKLFSESAFNKLPAAKRLRVMLTALAIPTAVPEGLCQLESYARAKNLDGPEIFTLIRNRLVHPPKPSTVQDIVPYYEAYRLAKWYLELAVLSVCGFRGKYSNRTRSNRWVGQVENVPWM